jgi:hypothetical protein
MDCITDHDAQNTRRSLSSHSLNRQADRSRTSAHSIVPDAEKRGGNVGIFRVEPTSIHHGHDGSATRILQHEELTRSEF